MDYLAIALDIIKNYKNKSVGVRSLCDDENYEVGDYARESYEWDFENDCSTYDSDGEEGERTNGTCATEIELEAWLSEEDAEDLAGRIEKAVEFNKIYGDKQVILVGGHLSKDSQLDEGEARIDNAKVIAKI
ncbi:hypothetical protein [Bacillus sp. 1P06AnD]|uniref:hypothetical protein n=1 Tax=Bacillus sp. 1P06AnD TaxID=3132208 RepID=UPI00399FB3FD